MKRPMLWLILFFWLGLGMYYYWYVIPSPDYSQEMLLSIVFCMAIFCTTHVVLRLLTKNERLLAQTLFLGFFLLDIWLEPSITGEKEPLIRLLSVLFSLSVLWYQPEKKQPQWRITINLIITVPGVIGLLHMHKAGFATWNPMTHIVVHAIWGICLLELLFYWLKLAFLALKKVFLKTKEETERVVADGAAFVADRAEKSRVSLAAMVAGGIAGIKKIYEDICGFFSRRKEAFVEWRKNKAIPALNKARESFAAWLPIFLKKCRGRLSKVKQRLLTMYKKYYPPLKKGVVNFYQETISKFKKEKFL